MKKYFENEYFYASFIKEEYYPYLIEHGYYEQAKEMQAVLFEFLLADGKYKEAIKVSKEFFKYF